MFPRALVLVLLALVPATAQAFEVVAGGRDYETWITEADGSVTRVYGAVLTLDVTRPEAPLTADDLPAAREAAGAYCSGQGGILAEADGAEAEFDPDRQMWTLFAWCEASD